MDVGGGTTDIAVIQEGGLQGTEMFGIGGRAFTRSIEREFDIDFVDAEKQKLAINEDTLPANIKGRTITAINRTLDVWVSGVELALSEFDHLDYLPNQILLCGGGASLEQLMERLEKEKWYDDLAFTKRPSVQHINPKDVANMNDTTGNVNDHTYVTAMGLLRVGLDTLQQQAGSENGTVRQRIDRMLRI